MQIMSFFTYEINEIKGYSSFHFFFLFIVILASIKILTCVPTLSDKKNRIIMLIIGIIFLLLELYKQIYYNVICESSSYNLTTAPNQLCTTPLFMCFLMAFLKEKESNVVANACVPICFFGGASVMIFPQSVLVPNLSISIQTMVWHSIMILLSFYLIKQQKFGKKKEELKNSILIFTLFVIIALLTNCLFYILYLNNIVKNSFNAFLISPFIKSSVIILKDIWAHTNWFVYFMVYYLGIITGFYVLWKLIYKLRRN